MTFQQALDSTELDYIHSAHGAAEYSITFCKNTVILHGQNTDDLSIPTSWASFHYTTISGDWNDVEINQVLFIGSVNDITQASFRGRVRSDYNVPAGITADIIYCNQSSDDFTNGAYFWIINSYDITNKLSYPSSQDPDTAVELLDYNHPFTALKPVIIGLKTAYVEDTDPITDEITISIDVSASFPSQISTSGVLDFLWEIAGATYIVGSDTDSVITVTVPSGEQWATLTATDSLGSSRRRKFYIRPHNESDPPFDYTGSIEISGNLSEGWMASIDVISGVDDLLYGTFVVVRRRKTIPSGYLRSNIAFLGWFTKENDSSTGSQDFAIDAKANFNITGVAGRLAAIESQETPMTMVFSAPTENGQIENLTPQRAMLHYFDGYTTAGELVDIDWDDFTDDWLFPVIPTQGEIAKQAMDSIARQWTAIIEYAPWGAICIALNIVFLDQTGRNNLPTIITYTNNDILLPGGITKEKDPYPNVGKVDCVGAFYSTTTKWVTDKETRSPGHARGESSGSGTLPNQILRATNNPVAAVNELRQRGANYYEDSNLQEYLDVDHPMLYTYTIPSKSEKYIFDITVLVPTDRGVNRIVYDNTVFWTAESITITIAVQEGVGSAVSVKNRYKRVPGIGAPGDDTTLIAPGEEPPIDPNLGQPAFDWELPELTVPDVGLDPSQIPPAALVPPAGKIATFTGQELFIWDDDQVAFLRNFINLHIPQSRDITPDNVFGVFIQGCIDPFYTLNTVPGYLLENNGTDSRISYNPNIATPNASLMWADGATINALCTVLRATSTSQKVMAYCPQGGGGAPITGSWQVTFDFSISPWGWYADPTYGSRGVWDGTRWSSDDLGGTTTPHLDLRIDFGNTVNTITDIIITYQRQTDVNGSLSRVMRYIGGGDTVTGIALQGGVGTYTDEHLGGAGTGVDWDGLVFNLDSGSPTAGPANFIYKVTLVGTGTPPILPGVGASVVVTDDRGVTVTSILPLSGSPGSSGGFDVQRSGGNSFASSAVGIDRASTLGGMYALWYSTTGGAQIACIIVPYYTWSGSLNTSNANPDVIIALTALDGSSRSLIWIEGGSTPGTEHDITPVAGIVFDDPNCITVSYNHHIAVFGKVSGVDKLYVTTNKGSSWTLVETLSTPTFIRCRRSDNRARVSGTNKGQLYVCEEGQAVIDYSSKWGTAGIFQHIPPFAAKGFDTVF